ncbi:hypothetical protein F4818DRAFT_451462 [Hypoxylon cercidicola]|nr:hypothetical protein F4818DRAFT_451462 [Hypoxylon cercidicola]
MSELQLPYGPVIATTGPPQPPIDRMMESRTGAYQGLIQDANNFEEVMDQYLRRNNVAEQDCRDFPPGDEQQRQLVREMIEASHDCSKEPLRSQNKGRIQQKHWADLEWELIMWRLLLSIRDAQSGVCNLPRYSSSADQPFETYETFSERFGVVLEALRLSKDIVASLFKDSMFVHRLAWKPRSELEQKARNRKTNEIKTNKAKASANAVLEKNVAVNENDESVNDEGQVGGQAKETSLAPEEKPSGASQTRNRRRRASSVQNRGGASKRHKSKPATPESPVFDNSAAIYESPPQHLEHGLVCPQDLHLSGPDSSLSPFTHEDEATVPTGYSGQCSMQDWADPLWAPTSPLVGMSTYQQPSLPSIPPAPLPTISDEDAYLHKLSDIFDQPDSPFQEYGGESNGGN